MDGSQLKKIFDRTFEYAHRIISNVNRVGFFAVYFLL
jgi:hypothetical protein